MVPDDLHDFFLAGASVAGALIGLLFVALTVASERIAPTAEGGQIHRIRASASLTAFTNALTVSLFALIPTQAIGPAAVAVGTVGTLFVVASLLSLIRMREVNWHKPREPLFLVGLIVIFVIQLIMGIRVIGDPGDSSAVDDIAVLVAVCSLFGVYRAWELVGGPTIGFRSEVVALARDRDSGPGGQGGTDPALWKA
ncbi:MAG: hypothetical protein J2P25_17260 [Nocardiopsaceae bacterium]|nr:hypothetical protein [Nocardiopsaceae bacterium]